MKSLLIKSVDSDPMDGSINKLTFLGQVCLASETLVMLSTPYVVKRFVKKRSNIYRGYMDRLAVRLNDESNNIKNEAERTHTKDRIIDKVYDISQPEDDQ